MLEKWTPTADFLYEKAYYASQIPEPRRALLLITQKIRREYVRDDIVLLCNQAILLGDIPTFVMLADKLELLEKLLPDERASVLYVAGKALFDAKELQAATKIMDRRGIEFDDEYFEDIAYMNGIAHKMLGDYRRAILQFSILQNAKTNSYLYFESLVDRGECHFALQEYAEAIKMYERYSQNKVTQERAGSVLLQLGNSNYNIKRYSKALVHYQRYLSVYGKNNGVHTIADALLKLGIRRKQRKR